ncbi:MAG: hypothetical protein HXK79_04345 [Lachnospiraceae bacterium]|nr:hypothetical protein [Lachnospiraceae bacterium]
MIKNTLKKMVFINVVLIFAFILGIVNRSVVFAKSYATEGELVDYLVERSNLGVFEDNSFTGKKQGLNKFGIEGLDYLTSPEESVTVEKLASVCADILRFTGEDKGVILSDDYSQFLYVDPETGIVLFNNGKWSKETSNLLDYKLKLELRDRRVVKKLGRVNDIKSAGKRHQLDLITVLKKGIIIGKSMGRYTQNRNLMPKRKVSLAEAKKVIEKVYDSKKRYPMSPDGQLLRKTNLPFWASDYKYILASYPDSYYETMFGYESHLATSFKLHSSYDPPKYTYERILNGYETNDNIYEEADKVRRFQNHRMNVDYRTIDKKWRDKLISFYRRKEHTKKSDLNGMKKEIDKYIRFVKENKVIIESKPVATDASSAYYWYITPSFHTYMKFRIVSCKNLDKNLYKIIYGSHVGDWSYGLAKYREKKVKLGEWCEGVYQVNYPLGMITPHDLEPLPWRCVWFDDLDLAKGIAKKTKKMRVVRVTENTKNFFAPPNETWLGWE